MANILLVHAEADRKQADSFVESLQRASPGWNVWRANEQAISPDRESHTAQLLQRVHCILTLQSTNTVHAHEFQQSITAVTTSLPSITLVLDANTHSPELDENIEHSLLDWVERNDEAVIDSLVHKIAIRIPSESTRILRRLLDNASANKSTPANKLTRKSNTVYVGDWLVERNRNVIAKDGVEKELSPKAMDLLCTLVEHEGNTVSKDELLKAVWNTVVGDSVIHQRISELRRAFEDVTIIDTVSKRGYRLAQSPTLK